MTSTPALVTSSFTVIELFSDRSATIVGGEQRCLDRSGPVREHFAAWVEAWYATPDSAREGRAMVVLGRMTEELRAGILEALGPRPLAFVKALASASTA
jgi:hypothetical protein